MITIYVHPIGNLYRQTSWTSDGHLVLVECDERGELTCGDCCQIIPPSTLRTWRHYHLTGTP